MTTALAREHLRSAIALVVTLIASFAFFIIAARHIAYPGLYYDEALFYPPAAKLYLGCDVPAGVTYQIGCIPVVLRPPYLGALKAWLYAGLFTVVEPSMLTIRLPMILVQFASIVLLTVSWAPRIGRANALLLFAILCTDTASIFHARIDWGPYALANFFKVAALCAAIAWVETGRPRMLALLGLSAVLGVYDKLNFLWVIGSLGAALLLVYGRDILAALRQRPKSLVILALSALGVIGVTAMFTVAVSNTAMRPRSFDLGYQIVHVWALLAHTLNEGPWGHVFRGEPWPGLSLASRIFVCGLAVGWFLVVVGAYLRTRLARNDPVNVSLRYAAFLTLMLTFLLVAMVATKETAGPHHVIVVSLLWPLQIVLCGNALVALAGRFSPQLKGAAHVPLAIAAALLLTHNLVSAFVFHHALDRGATGNPNFSPAIYKLVKYVDAHPGIPVVSVDWGTNVPLMALTHTSRRRFRDLWPTFIAIGNGNIPPSRPHGILGSEGKSMFVMHPEAAATFKPSVAGFGAALKPGCDTAPSKISDQRGNTVFLVVILPNSCLRDRGPPR
jgi:hypothetical protein